MALRTRNYQKTYLFFFCEESFSCIWTLRPGIRGFVVEVDMEVDVIVEATEEQKCSPSPSPGGGSVSTAIDFTDLVGVPLCTLVR